MILLFAAAFAGEPRNAVVVGAMGGLDFQTNQPVIGAEIVVHPTQILGPALVARFTPTLGTDELLPVVISELGFTWGIAHPEATIRVGATVRPVVAAMAGRLPLRFAGEDDAFDVGVLFGGSGLVELEWNPRAPLTVGFRGGLGAVGAAYGCEVRPEGFDDCRRWSAGFVGGFIARKRFPGRLAIELQIGNTSTISVGARLGKPTPPK